MAKKILTPEEVKAKIERKEAKNKLFFGTFAKALAVFLALVVAWSLVSIAFTLPSMVLGGGTGNAGATNAGAQNQTVEEDAQIQDMGDEIVDESGNTMTKADVINMINDVTAQAAKGNYKWARKSWYTSPLDVGNATGTLNRVIQMVDKNASLDSVVGGFLAISGAESAPAWEADVAGGQLPEGTKMNDEKFLFKGFSLTEGDIKAMQAEGNTYTMQLNGCKSPQKDGANPLNRVTNDFITKDEVAKGVADGLGSLGNLVTINSLDVDFTAIIVTVVIENNVLKSATISYDMTVNSLNLKAMGIGIEGTGAGKMTVTYTFA